MSHEVVVIRALNIFLRGSTLACRFLFIFFLAKYVEPSTLGMYGLFTAAVGYLLYFVGLDFYTYATREILKNDKNYWGRYLKGQIYLSLLLYIILFIISIPFVVNGYVKISILYWFIPILFLEHFNQEISRLLIALSKQTAASITLFVRQGAWALAAVTVMYFYENMRYIELIFSLWIFSGALAAALGVYFLHKLKFGGWRSCVDLKWMKKGIKTSAIFLLATLALRGIQTADRYWLEFLNNIDLVGAYVLFVGIAGTMMTFLDAGVYSFSYPKLIAAYNKSNKEECNEIIKGMFLLVVVFIFTFVCVSLMMLPFLLSWIGRDVYLQYNDLYLWVLLATVFNALGMIPHYALYAQGKDKVIVLSHGISAIIFVIFSSVMIYWDKAIAVPIGVVAAFAFIFLFKTYFFINSVKNS